MRRAAGWLGALGFGGSLTVLLCGDLGQTSSRGFLLLFLAAWLFGCLFDGGVE